jgi:membrane-bound serine protease (ClpP class)
MIRTIPAQTRLAKRLAPVGPRSALLGVACLAGIIEGVTARAPKRYRHLLPAALLAMGLSAWLSAQETPREPPAGVTLLTIDGAIGPATSNFIRRGIETAADRNAPLVVIEMDTPGGLDTSMRDIIRAILGSRVPVATFVHPQGARAASAGTYILYASHVAAMAPATNLGAATPVAIGGAAPASPADADADDEGEEGDAEDATEREQRRSDSMSASERKAVEDAVAYIRSLAEQRERNADWAERAVRFGESLSARAALELGVIDLIANDLADLLQQLDGRTVHIDGREITLATAGLLYDRIEPDWRTRLLAVISNPTVAYMLMLLGIYGLIFEGYNPGAIVPGVVGAISLLLALFALQLLPVNYAGLALILLGVILMIGEFLMPSFGALGIGGVAAFVIGSIILIDTDMPGFGVSLPLITSIALVASLTLLGIIWFAMKSRVRPVVSGVEEMAHQMAEALEDFEVEGFVWTHGERWRARSSAPVRKGDQLRVTRIDGLLLYVEPA